MATDAQKRLEIVNAIKAFIRANGGRYQYVSGHRSGPKSSLNHREHGGLDIGAEALGSREMQNKLIKYMLKTFKSRVIDERDGYSLRSDKRKKGKTKGTIHFDLTPGRHGFIKYLPSGSIYNPKTEEVKITEEEFDNYEKGFKTVEHGRRSNLNKALHNRNHFDQVVKGTSNVKNEKFQPLRYSGPKSKELKEIELKIKSLAKSGKSPKYSDSERAIKGAAYKRLLEVDPELYSSYHKHAKNWVKYAPTGKQTKKTYPFISRHLPKKEVKVSRQQQAVQNKALAEANIRIKELIKEDAKDLRIKEAKAIAYDDKIKAGGKEDQFSRYWRKFLPKYDQFDSEKEFLEFKETEKAVKNFPDGSTAEEDKQNKVPKSIVTSEDIQKTEGKVGIPFGMEESGMEEWEGKVSPGAEHRGGLGGFRAEGDPTRERIEEQISLREKAYESPSGLSPAQTAAMPTPKAKEVPVEEETENRETLDFQEKQSLLKKKDGGEIKKYGAGDLVEKEFYPGQEKQFQQNIGEEFTEQGETEIGDKPLMLEQLTQAEKKDPKPPVEASFSEQGDVVLTKQQETADTDKMPIEEIKEKLKETKEVTSEPGSDTVTLKTRPSQIQRSKKLKAALHKKKVEADPRFGSQEEFEAYQKVGKTPQPQLDEETLTEKITVEDKEADPKAFSIQDYIQQTLQRDDEARQVMQDELAKAAEVEQNLQKVEPFRFWNNMSTPAKIVAGIGMLIGGYAAQDSPAGLQAVMNVIDGAVSADINAQKLTREQQLSTAKEATRRATAAVNKYKALATNPATKAKLMELGQALEVKKAGLAKTQQLQALRQFVMNKARAGQLHLVPPALMRMVYPKEEMKRIDKMRENFEKERKDRKITPIISAYRRLHNLMSSKEEISGADDIAIVFQFMKMLDPNSVVREGEFKTAEGAGPRAKFFARQWNRMFHGGRFTSGDRKAFLQSSLKLVKPAMDEEKELQRKYVSMARRYGFPAAFIVSPSTRYFDLPGTMDDAAVRKIMKEQGKTREEAESIHFHVAGKVKKPRYMYRKGVKYPVRE